MLGPGPEAEDIGQETFIRFFRALNRFRGESGIGTYLVRIAINLSLNEIRRRKIRYRFHTAGYDDRIDELPDSRDDFKTRERKAVVRSAVQKLEPKFRSVIVLRLLTGYSTEETAEILKIPTGTVLSRLARAQSKLRDLISPVLGGQDDEKGKKKQKNQGTCAAVL